MRRACLFYLDHDLTCIAAGVVDLGAVRVRVDVGAKGKHQRRAREGIATLDGVSAMCTLQRLNPFSLVLYKNMRC